MTKKQTEATMAIPTINITGSWVGPPPHVIIGKGGSGGGGLSAGIPSSFWKIREKASGLYWTGSRYAALEGTFHEVDVSDLDDEREMVQLTPAAPVQEAVRAPAPSDVSKDPYWPREKHPDTGEDFYEGTITRERGRQVIQGPKGMLMESPVGGDGLIRGSFMTRSGSTAKGYWQGGAWLWIDTVTVKTAKGWR